MLLKSVPYHFTVVQNLDIEVYSDPEMTVPVVEYYINNIKKGEGIQYTWYVKNVGEAVNVEVTVSTAYVTVIPSTFSLSIGETTTVDFVVDVPFDALEDDYDGTVEFNSV